MQITSVAFGQEWKTLRQNLRSQLPLQVQYKGKLGQLTQMKEQGQATIYELTLNGKPVQAFSYSGVGDIAEVIPFTENSIHVTDPKVFR